MPPLLAHSTEPAVAQETINLINSSQEDDTAMSNDAPSQSETETSEDLSPEESVLTKCLCHGCDNPPKDDDQLEGVLCSNECAVKYSRDVFKNWVQSQMKTQEI